MQRSNPLKIALAYIGDEQPTWGRTAYRMPRHYFVTPAILFLQAALRAATEHDVRTVYCNRSVQDFDAMLELLRREQADVVGFSCYSWNIDDVLALVAALRRNGAGPRVILGGPDVAFANVSEAGELFERNPAVDGLVLGEGEGVVSPLIEAVVAGRHDEPIPGAVLNRGGAVIATDERAAPVDLATIPEIDFAAIDVALSPGSGVAIVYQTFRGCPYSCAYCSFHGGTAGIRRFPIERVQSELGKLLESRVECIHFADSVFDLKKSRAKQILSHLLENNLETSLFCYAAFQGLDEELVDLFDRNRMQIGVGLQSIHEPVLRRVGRRFSVRRFEESLRLVERHSINWYVDVMFGLPGDNMDGFRQTIDHLLESGPPFVMPFPVTVIPRTELARDLPGFEIIRYDDDVVRAKVRPGSGMVYADIGLYREFDLDDLARFDDAATSIFVVLQRYPLTVHAVVAYAHRSPARDPDHGAFEIMEFIGRRLKDYCGEIVIDPQNPPLVDGPIREAITAVLAEQGATRTEIEAFAALMRVEVGIDVLLRRGDRRRAHRQVLARRERLVEPDPERDWSTASESLAFTASYRLLRSPFGHRDTLRLPELRDRVEPRETQLAVIAPYDDFQIYVHELSDAERAICDVVPDGREIPASMVARRIGRAGRADELGRSIASLVRAGLLGVYRPRSAG